MKSLVRRAHTTIRIKVVTAFILVTALTASLAIGLQYYFGQSMARNLAAELYASAASRVATEMRSLATTNANVISLLADNPVLRDPDWESAHLSIFTEVLLKNPLYYGVYIGRSDGTFFEVVNLDTSEAARRRLDALPDDRWLIVSVDEEQGGRKRHFRYLDENLRVRLARSESTDFDVRTRPWYTNAIGSDEVHFTEPYVFAQLEVPGRTVSKRLAGSDSIVAIDMTLATMAEFLNEHEASREGSIFLYTPTGQVIASNVPGEAGSGATAITGTTRSVPGHALTDIAADPNAHGKLVETELDGRTYLAFASPTGVNENAIFMGILSPLDAVVSPILEQVLLSIGGTAIFLLLLIPATWWFANPIVRPVKQLALENDKVMRREFARVIRVRSPIKELDELSDSMVSMVDAIQSHEKAQRALMDAFIELIAQAIDDKSAYTGSHCKRVPELAIMLAEHASASDLPAFKSFNLSTDDEWREYRIAAWLHDCGKITTPEHIVDKGSKLELIYNRIHEIRMRFEVLWRDAQIEYLDQLRHSADKEVQLKEELKERQERLLDNFAFVASCNVGGESLDQTQLDRLQEIASQTWTRHFDDRLGLSPLEELRLPGRSQPTPATEQLLSDKPEHIIRREQSTKYPPELGINMEIPDNLYNQGELYNLSVSRGTLTEEDRFKINEHMISTIKMLESLPFPDELKNVPRYASTHHETMEGSGYPRRLRGEELSIPERLLAIADVFEALTAADRPYKKAKPVSEAIDILYGMVESNHLDRDCFELFIRDKIYERFAREFLPEGQLDTVNESRYLVH